MIKRLADDVAARAQEYGQLQTIISQADAVRATKRQLDEMSSGLELWAAVFEAIAPMILAQAADAVRAEAANTARQLAASQQAFASGDFRQASRLAGVSKRVQALVETTKEAWSAYAAAQIRPLNELARIAQLLPEMEQSFGTIQSQLIEIRRYQSQLPRQPQEIMGFESRLTELRTALKDLRGLPDEVQSFLAKVLEGEATFVDVTPTVFEWCHSSGLAKRLRFASL